MKRWLVGLLLVVLAGVLLVGVINSNRDPVAALKGIGGRILRNEQGEVVLAYLGDNRVTDAGLKHLRGMSKLETLELYSPQITDAGLVHLKGLTGLQPHPPSHPGIPRGVQNRRVCLQRTWLGHRVRQEQ